MLFIFIDLMRIRTDGDETRVQAATEYLIEYCTQVKQNPNSLMNWSFLY